MNGCGLAFVTNGGLTGGLRGCFGSTGRYQTMAQLG